MWFLAFCITLSCHTMLWLNVVLSLNGGLFCKNMATRMENWHCINWCPVEIPWQWNLNTKTTRWLSKITSNNIQVQTWRTLHETWERDQNQMDILRAAGGCMVFRESPRRICFPFLTPFFPISIGLEKMKPRHVLQGTMQSTYLRQWCQIAWDGNSCDLEWNLQLC